MQRFDQNSAVCQVFTYREGFLSSLAHDLRINVTSFVLELGNGTRPIEGRFDARSLRVDCAMVEGTPRPDLLTDRDKEEINGNIVKDVLDAGRFGEILLQSSSLEKEDAHYRVRGKLTLHGIAKEISFPVRRDDHSFVVEVSLHLPDFGIRPFSALFGSIRIKPDILIRVEVPADLLSTDFLN
jgi:hypothetical protein